MTESAHPTVELVPLTEAGLEPVRRWRNSEHVRKFMEFREEITPQMQQSWFKSINNRHNHYFIIVCDGKEIGLTNIKDIDYTTKSGETGIFIADPDYLDSIAPVLASILGLDFCFEQLDLETIYIKTAEENLRARQFNAAFGYEPVEGMAKGRFRHYKLTKQSYYRHREHLTDLLYGTD